MNVCLSSSGLVTSSQTKHDKLFIFRSQQSSIDENNESDDKLIKQCEKLARHCDELKVIRFVLTCSSWKIMNFILVVTTTRITKDTESNRRRKRFWSILIINICMFTFSLLDLSISEIPNSFYDEHKDEQSTVNTFHFYHRS